jgi:membrane-associated protease RseP (regulator of RpoE activity)
MRDRTWFLVFHSFLKEREKDGARGRASAGENEMKNLLRPYRSLGVVALLGAGVWVAMLPPVAAAQGRGIFQLLEEHNPLLLHSSSQGYLGVDLADVDQEKAQTLKLKEVRGAIITLIDHDAPAGQIGLRVNDVVIQLNGQNVEGAEQLRRMLREIPAGRKVSLEISRDGNIQTLAAQLADRRAMEHDVWNKIGTGGDVFAQGPGMGILAGGGDGSLPGGFHMPFFGSSLNVGALVEPLTSQMAEYLGVPGGLMVRQVARKSEASSAGLKAFDVILKVGPEAIATMADWERALHANQGKPVQVTVLRDRKQQTLTLQVDSKRHGELEFEEIFPAGDEPVMAGIEPGFVQQFAREAAPPAGALRDQLQAGGMEHFALSPEQVEALRKQADELRDSMKGENFKIDPKQLDQLKQQMDEFRKNFKPDNFKLDPKQMDELRQQMEQLKRQMEEIKGLSLDGRV